MLSELRQGVGHKNMSSPKVARIIMGIFLFGFFADYGGGLGIKYIVFLIAFLWILRYKKSMSILAGRWRDIMVLIFIPVLISILHIPEILWFSSGDISVTTYIMRLYNTISSPVLIMLYPLFRYVGSSIILRQMSIGFRLVAIILIASFILSILGIIDVRELNEISIQYKIGYLGRDPRLEDALIDEYQKVIIAPFIAFPMLLMISYEMVVSPAGAILLLTSLLLIGSRGLIIGAIILIIITIFFIRGGGLKRSFNKYLIFLSGIILIIFFYEPFRFRLTGVFFERTRQMINFEDFTTLVRIGHFEGYRNLIENRPSSLLFGNGPTGEIYNPFLGENRDVTEISVLNTALYYGIPYALLYVCWLYRAALKLWYKRWDLGFKKEDMALLLGAAIFWFCGNTNPQMNAPFSIFAYMLLVLRTWEIGQLGNINIRS